MTPYSLVEHVAKAIWFSRWQEGHFAVFSAYFDASGDETDKRTKFVSVAGFIASAEVWINFETEWLQRLVADKVFGKDGLPEFHMSDCANFTYAFDTWRGDDARRQNLLRDLVDILKPLGRKVCCVIDLEQAKEKLDSDVRAKFGLSAAYVLGGRACAARVKEWCWIDGSPPIHRVQFFFERGDGREIQLDLRHRLLNDEYPEPFFKSKRNKYSKKGDLIEERLVPFQASDVLAYLNFLDAKFSGQSWRDKEAIQWMLNELKDIPEATVQFDADLLPALNTYLRASSVLIGQRGSET